MNEFLVIEPKRSFMKNSSRMHEWATPFAIGAFALTALTGILLFFKIHLGLVKPVHEWLSWLLIIGTAFHLGVNWRPTVRYFTRPIGRAILLVFFVLICASLLPVGGDDDHRHNAEVVTQALLQAPLASVVQVAGQTPEKTIEVLSGHGIYPSSLQQTPQEIAVEHNRSSMDILSLIFKK